MIKLSFGVIKQFNGTSSKSTIFGIPPYFRINFRANLTFPTFDIVSAARTFKSLEGSDKMFTNKGIPPKSTIDRRTSMFREMAETETQFTGFIDIILIN